ncbi:MAG: hypothetical protein AAGE89_10545 [Pseudomonadota bacterium]
MQAIQSHFERLAVAAIVMGVAAAMTAAAFAWSDAGSTIWTELRLAEIAGCFGF